MGPRVFTTNFWGTEKGEIKKTIILNWRRPTQKCQFLKHFFSKFVELQTLRYLCNRRFETRRSNCFCSNNHYFEDLSFVSVFYIKFVQKMVFYVSIKICWYETSLFDVWFYAAINEIEIANFNYCKEELPTQTTFLTLHVPTLWFDGLSKVTLKTLGSSLHLKQ